MRVFYLHGFASSTARRRRRFLTQRFQEQGISMRTPDLNLPDFSTLTVSRMLAAGGRPRSTSFPTSRSC